MIKQTYEERKRELLNNFTIHNSLKDCINIFDNKDVLDSYYDAKILLELLELRVNENFYCTYKENVTLTVMAEKQEG